MPGGIGTIGFRCKNNSGSVGATILFDATVTAGCDAGVVSTAGVCTGCDIIARGISTAVVLVMTIVPTGSMLDVLDTLTRASPLGIPAGAIEEFPWVRVLECERE